MFNYVVNTLIKIFFLVLESSLEPLPDNPSLPIDHSCSDVSLLP